MSKKMSIGSLAFCQRLTCSLEIEVPFITACFGNDISIVPIMVGRVATERKTKIAEYLSF